MSDYVKGQNFTALRGSTPADPAVFDTEFTAVATASATKMDKSGGTFTGPIYVPAAGATGETTKVLQAQDVKHYAFPSGTKMVFFQATAPVGWTQDTTHNDAVLRIVSTTGGGTGGTGSIATGVVFPTSTDGHVLTVNEMPAHTHQFNSSSPGGTFGAGYQPAGASAGQNTTSTGGGAAHSHTITASNWQPKYIDMILCTKD